MSSNSNQLESARRQVEDVQNIMRSNIEKVLERDGKLSTMDERAANLQVFYSFYLFKQRPFSNQPNRTIQLKYEKEKLSNVKCNTFKMNAHF
jgi:hypothetical protein